MLNENDQTESIRLFGERGTGDAVHCRSRSFVVCFGNSITMRLRGARQRNPSCMERKYDNNNAHATAKYASATHLYSLSCSGPGSERTGWMDGTR